MAVTFGNCNYGGGGGTAQEIAPPTGLQVNDLMILNISTSAINASYSVPDGFELLQSSYTTSKMTLATYWKVATQTDVDTSVYTVTLPSSTHALSIFNIRNTQRAAPSYIINTASASSSVTTTGLTPTANSMLAILGAFYDTNSGITQSSYSIVTSNPTWTEQFDYHSAAVQLGHALATGLRAAGTATSTSSVSASTSLDTYKQILFAFPPYVGVNYTLTAAVGSCSLTGNAVSLEFGARDIATPTSKVSPSMTNTARASASMTNTARETSSVTNTSRP